MRCCSPGESCSAQWPASLSLPAAERARRPQAPRAVLGRPADSMLFLACLFLYKGFGSENQETPDAQSFAARVSVKS
jgi:hypothetical protein